MYKYVMYASIKLVLGSILDMSSNYKLENLTIGVYLNFFDGTCITIGT